jgi:hypothetical protein
MKKLFSIIIVLLIASPAISQDIHIIGPNTWSKQPLQPSAMNNRIDRAATELEQYAPVPRIGLFDIAYPADEDEYKALNGFAVMLVTALSQKADELPPKRVFVKIGDAISELTLISSVFSKTEPTQLTAKVFGENRWDGLFLFPVYLERDAQELLIDFAKNREGFVLSKFKSQNPEALKKYYLIKPNAGKTNSDALLKIVSREFPGFIIRK